MSSRCFYDELSEWIDLYNYAESVIKVYKKNKDLFKNEDEAYLRIWEKIFKNGGVDEDMQKIFTFNWTVPRDEYYSRPTNKQLVEAWFDCATEMLKIVKDLKRDCPTLNDDFSGSYYDIDEL